MIDWSEGLRDLATLVGVPQKIFETAITRHSKSLCKQVNAGLRVSADEYLKTRTTNENMKNRNIILTAIPSLLAFGGLSYTALAQVAAPAPAARTTTPVTVVNTATNPVPITGTVGVAENPARITIGRSSISWTSSKIVVQK